MRIRSLAIGWLACLLVLLEVRGALASFPQLNLILPRGVQRGGERELVFHGARLKDAEQIFFYSPDPFEVRKLEAVDDNTIKVLLMIPDNVSLGEHLVQIRTRSGISEYRSFMVGALPVVDEKEPNGSLEEAQAIEMNVTVHGTCENEDVDFFAVKATKGQRISVDIEAMRLGSYLFDPYIAILDKDRFELAAVDDSPAALQDGVLSVLAPEDGTYYVQVRETSYGGNGECRYRLNVGHFPRPTAVYPAGGKAGEPTAVQYLGDAAGPLAQDIAVRAEQGMMKLFPSDANGICPSAITFRSSPFGNALEQEPNQEIATANPVDATLSFNGIIGQPGDVDCFKFAAKKGQVFDVECFARRIRSGLDPVINIYYADGRSIAGNDDSRGPDAYIRFQVPEDAEYVVRVADHLGRGQVDFVYRIELQPIVPSLTLSIPRIDRYSQTRQTIFVPRGNRFAVLVNASRSNFGGELKLDDSVLPPGMKMVAQNMHASLSQMPVVFEAAADAPIGGKLAKFEASHVDPATGIRGHFQNNADFILGPPNNAVYYNGQVEQLAFAVIEELPFQVEIVQPKAPIVRNGTMQLKVQLKRAEGFKEAVTVEFPFRSPGIGAGSSIQIPAEQNEAVYTLNADGNAAIGTWPIYVIAQGNIPGGPAWASSQLATLEVAEPYTNASLARAACEQGETAQIVCTLAPNKPFEGEAIARLQGLPPNAVATEMKFTAETTELVFEVKTTGETPVGNHKTVFVELVTTVQGEPVQMRGGGTEFQVAAPSAPPPPPPPMPAAAAAPMPMPTPEPPKEKPLTRLEKLRLQNKKPGGTP